MTLHCIHCNVRVAPLLAWHRGRVRAGCPQCGERIADLKPTPDLERRCGARPAAAPGTGDLFDTEEDRP